MLAGMPRRLLTMGLLVFISSQAQQPSGERDLSKQLKDGYGKHDINVRQSLPPYSGPPFLLDLSHRRLEDGMCDPEQHVAWETRFNGIMASDTVIGDRGFSQPEDAATATTTIDTFAPVYSLPAKGSDEIVIAKPISGRVCIPRSRHYVYTKFTLEVSKAFPKARDSKKGQNPQQKGQVTAVQFGGEHPLSFRLSGD